MPAKLELISIQTAIRNIWAELDGKVGYKAGGRQVTNAHPATTGSGLVTLSQLTDLLGKKKEIAGGGFEYLFHRFEAYLVGESPPLIPTPSGVCWFDTIMSGDNFDEVAFTNALTCERAGRYLYYIMVTLYPNNDPSVLGDYVAMVVNEDGVPVMEGGTETEHWRRYFPVTAGNGVVQAHFCGVLDMEEGGTITLPIGCNSPSTDYNQVSGYNHNRAILVDLTRSI
jgi:hypothetical protein